MHLWVYWWLQAQAGFAFVFRGRLETHWGGFRVGYGRFRIGSVGLVRVCGWVQRRCRPDIKRILALPNATPVAEQVLSNARFWSVASEQMPIQASPGSGLFGSPASGLPA